jgi:hypothetical protein
MIHTIIEPFRIKAVEPIRISTRGERRGWQDRTVKVERAGARGARREDGQTGEHLRHFTAEFESA